MFPWNFAKSAEAAFSRWAVKRVVKFLLKKKLGKLILGDIDLDQLDIQLRDGTIQLCDLAIDVDYFNHKFDAPLLIKEGSIGSLLVKMPWKTDGCQVELDELELVLAPRLESNASSSNEASTSTSTRDDSHSVRLGLGKHENEMLANGAKSASIDVHEGVKTVAKIVKWFLTSFHVKIKNLIIAFDPDFGKEQIGVGSRPTLVLRMTEIECGISEDPTSEVSHDSFLGINRLANSVKFHGAVVEILNMDDDDDDDEKTCSKKASDDVTLIMTGEGGGFSGSLNLSMPWRNGSLDIRKVDADIFIDPIELRFQPSTIKWFLRLWKTFISFGSDSFPSHANSSTDSIPPSAIVMPPAALSLSGGQEVVPDITPELQFIPDWFPSSFSKKEEDGEVDIGGSVDQFFECFDAMRSYQSAFGSQGMWNWTSSVFTAINAASSLASGSLLLPSEQQHIETSCKVSFAGVSVVLFFQDEDTWKHLSTGIHYLGAELREISVSFQVRPQNMRLEGEVNSVEIADYFQAGNVTETANAEYQSSLIKNLQAEVQATLPPFASSVMNADSERSCEIVSDGFLFCNKGLAVKTLLVIAAGDNGIHFMVNFQSSKAKYRGSNSFSLSLPPTTFWLNLHSVEMLVNLFNDVSESIPITSQKRNQVASSLQSERLQGRISILNARVILCFPFDSSSETLYKSLGEEFIVINLSSSLPSDKERRKDGNPGEMHFTSATRAVCFSVGDASIYLVSSDLKDSDTNSDRMQDEFSAYNIIVTNNRTSHQLSTIGIFWQDKPIVSPSLGERAKMLATHEESIQTGKSRGNGLEFAAVATAKDQEDIYSQTRKEIILASSFCLYVHLLPLAIRLDSWQYSKLCSLIDQAKNWLSCMSANITGKTEESVVCQTSLVVDCDSVDILVRPEPQRGINNQLQVELPGSWIQFNLRVQKLNIMSVSNLGSISGAHLFWLCHGEGTLWGSVTGLPDQELLLLSCDNSAIKRGNGGGSNALSSRFAGLDILHLQEPETCYDYLSVSARGCTISAVGGRLDWIDVASSFFTFQVGEKSEERKSSASSGSSFNLCLVDIGLSYEPRHENTDHIPQSSDPLVACLLAASSFSLSKTSLVDSKRNNYIIRIQDLGLLLSANMDRSRLDGTYSSENLHKTGYVKVANGAVIKAALRTNSESGLLWELECSKSHLLIETCSDTTSGLTSLATQLQQLFAPDLEESAVHLQTRWDNIQQANAKNDFGNSSKLSSSDSSGENLRLDSETGVVGLMGEINEDAFKFDVSHSRQPDSLECQNNYMSPHGQSSPVKVPLCGSSSRLKPESSQIFLERDRLPEIIENYCLSTSLPSSEVPQEGDSSRRPLFLETDLRRGNSGWYDDVSLRILEDHLSEATEEDQEERILDGEFSSSDLTSYSVAEAIGRVLLKKINLKWRIYSGSDWADSRKKNMKGRDTTSCLELELSGVQFLYEIFPIGGICTSSLSLMVQDFYLYDRSKAAPWTLVLGYYNSKERPRDSSSDAFKLELKAVRPDPGTPLEENRLRVALLPILLHLHQSQLDFLINFFGANNIEKPVVSVENSDGSTLPVSVKEHNIIEEAFLPYFQKFDIWPVSVRVDYSPHHVDIAALTGGKYAELLNLVPWKGIELHLKHVHAAGIYGWGNVCETILGEWLEDISQNQIRQLLKGIPTLKSLSALYAAATKLVSSPVESYRKDRRLVKGVQRGTIAFLRSISLEAVGLGVHLAAGAHDILLRAEYMFASAPSLPQPQGKTKTNVRHNQPRNAKQGMLQACESISDGIGKSASALVRAPLKKYQRGDGAGSAFATAVQGVPTAAIATASAVARAGHTTFVGFRNSLDPEHKKESMEKYSGPNKQRNQDQHR